MHVSNKEKKKKNEIIFSLKLSNLQELDIIWKYYDLDNKVLFFRYNLSDIGRHVEPCQRGITGYCFMICN